MTATKVMTCKSCLKQIIYAKDHCRKVTIDTGFIANTQYYCYKCFRKISDIIVNDKKGRWLSVIEDGLHHQEEKEDLLIIDSDGFYGIVRKNESIESIKNIRYYMILPRVPGDEK